MFLPMVSFGLNGLQMSELLLLFVFEAINDVSNAKLKIPPTTKYHLFFLVRDKKTATRATTAANVAVLIVFDEVLLSALHDAANSHPLTSQLFLASASNEVGHAAIVIHSTKMATNLIDVSY